MAVNINNDPYSRLASNGLNSRIMQRSRTAGRRTQDVRGEETGEVKQPELSDAAKDLLERLKDKYSNMDIMVADFGNDKEAQEILSRGTKEYSVLFSPDEVEKMAADEGYEKKNTDRIDSAVTTLGQMGKDLDEAGEVSGGSTATRVGIAFNQDGSTSYFAELENSSARQRERIDRMREERAEEKQDIADRNEKRKQNAASADERVEERAADRNEIEERDALRQSGTAEKDATRRSEWAEQDSTRKSEENNGSGFRIPVKRTIVQASSPEELLQKASAVDWSRIRAVGDMEGARFDFSV